jgi:hypothetical protein
MSLLRADRIANRYNNTGPIIVGPSTVHGDFTITGNLIVAGIAVTNGVTVGGALTANTLKATNLVESVYGNITGVATINTIRGATYFGVGNNITGVTTLIKEGSGILVLSGTPQDGGFTNNVTLSARNVVESQFATEAGVSTNLVGGDAGKIPYQSATDTTGFTDVGSAGQILQSQGTAKPTWTSLSAFNVAYADSTGISTDIFGGSAGRLVYQSGIDQTSFVPVGASGRVLVAQGSLSPAWVDPNVGLSVSFAKFAGLSTNVSGGIASVTQLNVGPGISTFNGPLLAQGNINVTGVTTTVDLRVSSAATINNLTLQTGPGVAVTAILDEDTFVSDRDDALATQQSIKAYVDSQVTAQDLDVSTDDGTIAIDLDSEVLGINGASNEIYITATGNDVTVGLNTDVIISNDLTVTGNAGIGSLSVSGISTFTNGPVFIGTDTSNGNQLLQIDGSGYVSGNLGIGETQPTGIATETNTSILNVGVVTANFFYGDGGNLTNVEGYPDVENILYVSKSGNDLNSGTRLSTAKRTVGAALTLAKDGTVIKISAGTYEENNPLKVPAQVSLIGDSLRDTTIIPLNVDQDLFHVKGGDYISDMSFVGTMNSDKAVIAFDPDSPDYIIQSPYVRNCTNFINESIGMKIDGADAIGRIKSMVVDSYTQYNQGGIGVSITNEGYAQLVSIFTICSEIAIYCGAGGACDLTNSNSSFGDYGLIAEGIGPRNFTGVVTEAAEVSSSQFVLDLTPTTLNVSNADYDNVSGLVTFTTTTDHNLVVGTAITIKDLKFTCDSFNPVTSFSISTANYDNVSGIMTVQTNTDHNFVVGLAVTFNGLVFECDSGGGLSTAIFPPAPGDGNGPANHVFDVITVGTSTEFSVLVGPSTISHGYVESGNVAISTISTFPSGTYGNIFVVEDVVGPQSFSVYVGVSSFVHSYDSGGEIEEFITRPYDGQVIYFGDLFYTVDSITVTNRGSGYTSGPPTVTIDSPSEDWGIAATATASVVGGIVDEIDIVSTGRGYTSTPPTVTFSAPAVGINTAEGTANLLPTYYVISESTPISNGICTITVTENVPFAVGVGTTTPFFKQSRILASSHSFEYIGSGTSLNSALPQDGGVPIQENEIVNRNGGLVIYTSTDQAGNFRIGDGVIINQQTGTITGDDYTRSLFATMTPFILALGGD